MWFNMSNLSPEERHRIYLEQKALLEAQEASRVRNRQPGSNATGIIVLLVVVVGLFLVGTVVNSHQSPTSVRGLSTAQQLAVIDNVASDDVKINRYQSLLTQLSSAYGETEVRISDMTVTATQILLKKGITESNLTILEGMNRVFPGRDPGLSYSETMSMYMALRDKGESHERTVEGLGEMLQNPAARQMLLDRIHQKR
jgi:hypothetical protein